MHATPEEANKAMHRLHVTGRPTHGPAWYWQDAVGARSRWRGWRAVLLLLWYGAPTPCLASSTLTSGGFFPSPSSPHLPLGSEFDEMFVGVGARRVRELFGNLPLVVPPRR